MKSAENSDFLNDVISGNEMPVAALRRKRMQRRGNGWTKAHVWSTVIVVQYPFRQDAFQVELMNWDEKVQTLPAQRSTETLAYRVRLRRPHWSSDHPHAHGGHAHGGHALRPVLWRRWCRGHE